LQDTGYFLGLLRTKIGDIAAEIQRMRSELDRAAKDSVVTAQLERRYDVLLREVRSLEGDLADFNLAMDKSRSAVVDAGEIVVVFQAVRHRNEALARELDAIFVERQERERGAARLEEQVQELQRQSEARINSLPGQQVQAYRAMTQESRSLGAEAQRRDLRQRRAGAVLGTHEVAEQTQTERTHAGRGEGVVADLELRAREARVSRLELDHR
jgi:intraflagellar transport protein 74